MVSQVLLNCCSQFLYCHIVSKKKKNNKKYEQKTLISQILFYHLFISADFRVKSLFMEFDKALGNQEFKSRVKGNYNLIETFFFLRKQRN